MTTSVTILQTVGPHLTKRYFADGSVESYADAKSFKVHESKVSDLAQLHQLLTKLESNPQRSVVRGKFVGEEKALKGGVEGTFLRKNVNFEDQALQWMSIDVDGYRPGFADPVHEPVEAIQDYIRDCLPPCFHGASFHWQLSSSAGQPGKEHILKAHLWFWLKTAYTSAQLYAWATAIGPVVDRAFYRQVQHNYTARPLFDEGVADPVPVRSGLYIGAFEEVDLQISEATLEQARATGGGSDGKDMKLRDPSEKDGLVGLFHRVFTAEEAFAFANEGPDGEQFVPGSTDRRWTWLNGGGTPEGVWVHDDGMHIHAVHNTWPLDSIVNLWDFVRHFRFGHLDPAGDTGDELDELDAQNLAIQSRPSHLAMLEWAGKEPQIIEAIAKERDDAVQPWLDEINAAASMTLIETSIAPRIREVEGLTLTDRERIAVAIQNKAREQLNIRLPIANVRRLVAPPRRVVSEGAPDWATAWVWVRELDAFMNVKNKIVISERSYNASYDRHMARFADENGSIPRASEMALTAWDTKVFDRALYYPMMDWEFWHEEHYCINTYREDLVPKIPDKLTCKGQEAIAIVEAHAELIIPDARERMLVLDWIAYCVQNPGRKIRWAVLLKGIPGDGKTAFAMLMAACMGGQNVRSLSSNTLEGSDFSGWGAGQCVVAIEEVKIQGVNRHDVFNKLKPYITNDVIEVHPKGKDPRNVPNTSNYFLLTNHNDALPLDDNDRRIMPVWSPFVTREHLFKAIQDKFGLETHEYFDRLFDVAIKGQTGALRRWLLERELSPEFKADGRAPVTSARRTMVDISKGDDELAVEECLRVCGEGVYRDIVSVTHLREMVVRRFNGMSINTRRVANIMADLGYVPFKRFQWKGRDSVVYLLGDGVAWPHDKDVAFVRLEMDRLEKDRLSSLIEQDFED